MKLSAILTIHDRPFDVLRQVFDSLAPQIHDELVIVLDRTPVVTADYCVEYWKGDPRTVFVETGGGPPGWRSPVKAWNAGFRKATGDVFYCLSSETVQAESNLRRAREFFLPTATFADPMGFSERSSVLHGRAECSCGPTGQEVNWGGTAPGNLLGDAAHPRPLGFIWAAPASSVREIGGYDEEFDAGLWHDDDDFFFRLWRTGLDFVFDDSISGLHLHHDRPVLATPEGQEATRRNARLMIRKHGILHPLVALPRIEERREGRTTWRHL